MKLPSTFTIEQLMTYKENSQLEVKSARGGLPNSLWESYSAFANSEGGVIILGVKENEDGPFFVEGLKDTHKLMKDFWNTVNNRQKVSCNILTAFLIMSLKTMTMSLKTASMSLKTTSMSLKTMTMSLKTMTMSLKTMTMSLKTASMSLKTITISLKTMTMSLKTMTMSLKTASMSLKTMTMSLKPRISISNP